MEKISIIVPIYNVEKYLERCIESILKQTYTNIELILVNDGSLDKCGTICDEYAEKDNRIKVIHKINSGLSSARNAGLSIATGNYIAFIDSDDWIKEDMVAYLYFLIKKYEADISICGYFAVDKKFKMNHNFETEKIDLFDKNEILNLYFRVDKNVRGIMFVWRRLYRKEILQGISFTEGMTSEDIDFSYRIFNRCEKCVVGNLKKYFYNLENNNSITRSKVGEKNFHSLDMWNKVIILVEKENEKFLKYAKLNKLRAEFTLIYRWALYGAIFKDISYYNRKQRLLKNIRANFSKLFFLNDFSIYKKIFLILIFVNFSFAGFILHLYLKKDCFK